MIRKYFSSFPLQEFLKDMDGYRDFVFVISSILRIIVIGNFLTSMSVSTYTTNKSMQNNITRVLSKPASLCIARLCGYHISNIHVVNKQACDVSDEEGLQRMFSGCDEGFNCSFQFYKAMLFILLKKCLYSSTGYMQES